MQTLLLKRSLWAAWTVFVLVAVFVVQSQSPAIWIALALIATVPPAILLYLWKDPVPSTSEQIQDALR